MFLQNEFNQEIKRLEAIKRQAALQRVKDATPVDTGAAKRSWRIDGKDVVSDSQYINSLNEGSSVQAPSYFIEKAILTDTELHPNGTIVLKK